MERERPLWSRDQMPELSPGLKVLGEGLGPCTYTTSLQIPTCEHSLTPPPHPQLWEQPCPWPKGFMVAQQNYHGHLASSQPCGWASLTSSSSYSTYNPGLVLCSVLNIAFQSQGVLVLFLCNWVLGLKFDSNIWAALLLWTKKRKLT